MFGSGGKKSKRRVEPTFDDAAPRLQADPEDTRAHAKPAKKAGKKRPRRRSLLGGLFYWGFVFGVWGVIALGAAFAY